MNQEKSGATDRRNVNETVRSAYFEAAPDKRDNPIDEQIRKAQEQGQFDNLPGYGKPLPRDTGYEMAGEHWMSNHILKQAGYMPIWLELRKEIMAERDEVRAALAEYREQSASLGPSDSRARATLRALEERYVQLARDINVKIDQHNERCPNTQLLNRFAEDATR